MAGKAEMTIITEDNYEVHEGDTVFNYYDLKWGTIRQGSTDNQGWFTLDHTDGTSTLLNGERICTKLNAHLLELLELKEAK
jgi:hypothetical protein